MEEKLLRPILHFDAPPVLVQLIHLLIIIVGVYAIYKFFTNALVARKLTEMLRKHVIKRQTLKSISHEELLVATGGYGVATVRIRQDHSILGKSLSESGLRKEDINVLAIVRASETMPNPRADEKILSGDELICFGKLEHIRDQFT
jgi:Trk K+ transport system NAD-binding subunit